jgi:hypothetical protein
MTQKQTVKATFPDSRTQPRLLNEGNNIVEGSSLESTHYTYAEVQQATWATWFFFAAQGGDAHSSVSKAYKNVDENTIMELNNIHLFAPELAGRNHAEKRFPA